MRPAQARARQFRAGGEPRLTAISTRVRANEKSPRERIAAGFRGLRLTRDVEPRLSFPVLDLDNPEVGIELNLSLEPLVRVLGIYPLRFVHSHENPLDAGSKIGRERLRGRPVYRRATVKAVDLHKDRAGLRRAASAQHDVYAFSAAPPQIGGDPDIGPQPHVNVLRLARRRPAASPDGV